MISTSLFEILPVSTTGDTMIWLKEGQFQAILLVSSHSTYPCLLSKLPGTSKLKLLMCMCGPL